MSTRQSLRSHDRSPRTPTAPAPGTIKIAPRGDLPEADVARPTDRVSAWRTAWAYADEHAPGHRWSARGVAHAAFGALCNALDEAAPAGRPGAAIYEQDILARVAVGHEDAPDYGTDRP